MKENEIELLKLLEVAISDVGYWNWWDAILPDIAQLEFGGIQLYLKNEDSKQPPFSTISLQFNGLCSFSFLSKSANVTKEKWYELLHQDKFELPDCDSEYFTLTDEIQMKEFLSYAKEINTVTGVSPQESSFWRGKYKLVFWAKDYGCAVSAENLKLLFHSGEILLEKVPIISKEWWNYWRQYHDLRMTGNPMPKDYACEVTIPITY